MSNDNLRIPWPGVSNVMSKFLHVIGDENDDENPLNIIGGQIEVETKAEWDAMVWPAGNSKAKPTWDEIVEKWRAQEARFKAEELEELKRRFIAYSFEERNRRSALVYGAANFQDEVRVRLNYEYTPEQEALRVLIDKKHAEMLVAIKAMTLDELQAYDIQDDAHWTGGTITKPKIPLRVVDVTRAQYEKLVADGTVDPSIGYLIVD